MRIPKSVWKISPIKPLQQSLNSGLPLSNLFPAPSKKLGVRKLSNNMGDLSLPTPQSTLVILLGASQWPHYPAFQNSPSRAFAHAAKALRTYFLTQYALHEEHLLDLFDSPLSADK